MSMLKKLIADPMSESLINKYLNGRANVKTMSSLTKYKTISALFGGYDHCIIFTAIENVNSGHWQCIYVTLGGILVWFDSYGFTPQYVVNHLKNETIKNMQFSGMQNLLKLIYDHGETFFMNTFQFQQLAPGVDTCGRYCTLVCAMNRYYGSMRKQFLPQDLKEMLENVMKRQNLQTYDQAIAFLVDKF